MKIKFKKLHEKAQVPQRANPTDAGYDLVATSVYYEFHPTNTITYGTGLAIQVPEGYVGLLFPRSSVYKKDLSLANGIGVLDSGYQGEVKFIFRCTHEGLSPHTRKEYQVGDRIGQLIVMPIPELNFEEVEELDSEDRGGGFGSTGA